MSQENVEAVKAMSDAFNCGDVETATEMLHPTADFTSRQRTPMSTPTTAETSS